MVRITYRFLDGTGGILHELIQTHDANSQMGSLFPQHPHVEVEYGPAEEGGGGVYYLGTVRCYRQLTGTNDDASGSFLGWHCERCDENHLRFTSWSSSGPENENMNFRMDACLSDQREDHYPHHVTASQIHSVMRALAEEGRTEKTVVYARPCNDGCGPHWYVMNRKVLDDESNVITEECIQDALNHALVSAGFNAPHLTPDQELAANEDAGVEINDIDDGGDGETDISQTSGGDGAAQEEIDIAEGSGADGAAEGESEIGQGAGGDGAAEAEGQGSIPWGLIFSVLGINVEVMAVKVLFMIVVWVLTKIRRNNQ